MQGNCRVAAAKDIELCKLHASVDMQVVRAASICEGALMFITLMQDKCSAVAAFQGDSQAAS